MPLLFAAAVVFILQHPYENLLLYFKNRSVSAFIMTIIMILFIAFPTYWLATSLIDQSSSIISSGNSLKTSIDLSYCNFSFCDTIENNFKILDGSFEDFLVSFQTFLSKYFNNFVESLTSFFVDIFVFILAFFFLLRDGDKFVIYIKRIIPMKLEYKNALFLRFREVSSAVFVNTLLVAIIQGALTGFGLWIAGFNAPIFWSIIASFAALLPLFGPSLVWGPATIFLFLTNDVFMGVFLLFYGLVVISVSDNIIRPILLKRKVKVHEFLILLSILGGMKVFGFFMGIFLGPIIISLLVSVLQLYNLDFK